MKSKIKIEIFSAGCAVCEETIELVNKIDCLYGQHCRHPRLAGRGFLCGRQGSADRFGALPCDRVRLQGRHGQCGSTGRD